MTQIRSATREQEAGVAVAIEALKNARNCLRVSDCPQALAKTRAALRSAEGAQRHMQQRRYRAHHPEEKTDD